MPEVILAEKECQAFKVLAFQAVFQRSLSHLDDVVDILQDLEGFSPQAELSRNLELLHPDLDIPSIHISLLDVDIDRLLLLVLITLTESSL